MTTSIDIKKIPTVEKQPSEQFPIGFDWSNNLDSEEALDGEAENTAVAIDKDGNDVTSTLIVSGSLSVVGNVISCVVTGGTESASPYLVTILAFSDSVPPQKLEGDIKIKIKEKTI